MLKEDYGNALSILSIALGIENLMENRQQTAQNDVNKANDKQAQYLIEELGIKFDEQNKLLEKILEKLNNDGK